MDYSAQYQFVLMSYDENLLSTKCQYDLCMPSRSYGKTISLFYV